MMYIEKKNPLKQGLKPKNHTSRLIGQFIEKKNPLKQGLKLGFTQIVETP